MATTTVAGRELYYERRGAGEPLLLIQGMGGTNASWGEPFLSQLEDDFELVVYDHRGAGLSGRVDEPFTIAELAADAADLLDALALDRVHVLGISMGGMVAQELALANPERLLTLVLGCTYCGGPGSRLADPAVGMALRDAMLSGDREQAFRVSWEVNASPGFRADESRYAAFREMAATYAVPVAVITMQALAAAAHDTSARLPSLEVPTLVVHGTADAILPSPNGELIASLIPGARLVLLEDVGHVFWWEQPQRSAELVREHALAGAAQ